MSASRTDPSFPITAAQAVALGKWTYTGDDASSVQLTSQRDGSLSVTQGDENALIEKNGRVIEAELRR